MKGFGRRRSPKSPLVYRTRNKSVTTISRSEQMCKPNIKDSSSLFCRLGFVGNDSKAEETEMLRVSGTRSGIPEPGPRTPTSGWHRDCRSSYWFDGDSDDTLLASNEGSNVQAPDRRSVSADTRQRGRCGLLAGHGDFAHRCGRFAGACREGGGEGWRWNTAAAGGTCSPDCPVTSSLGGPDGSDAARCSGCGWTGLHRSDGRCVYASRHVSYE